MEIHPCPVKPEKTMGHEVHIKNVTMRFGSTTAISNLDVHIKAGEFFSFLGPSGCGKTTLLKLISGFLDPTEGRIEINRQDMNGVGPNKRPTAMIFQNLALFPLMTVEENIAFGLEVRGVGKVQRRKKVEDLLDLVDLPHTRKKKVTSLSGGQKQRVAIARALAVEPSVLLLDEPLSALDLKLRKHMRVELRQIQQKTGVTFIYITHDQGEALTMSDRVGVISEGGILEQVGRPTQIYNHPQTPFVASFVGENNVFQAKIIGQRKGRFLADTPMGTLEGIGPVNFKPGQAATAFVRPETIRLVNGSGIQENQVKCLVISQRFEGAFMTMELETKGDTIIRIRQSNNGHEPVLKQGENTTISFGADNTLLLAAPCDHQRKEPVCSI
jgi:spermidine/putrescine transport system ATP-binding protein